MRTIMASRRMLGWLGLLAAVAVAGCTASPAPGPSAQGYSGSASPAATSASPAATSASPAATSASPAATSASPVATAAVSSVPASGSASAGPGGVRNLVVSQDVRAELTAAYVAFRGISPADVAGTAPGSVYYAYEPATDTYWAQADFEPSSAAPFKVKVGFQDGASIGFFTRTGNGSWQARYGGVPLACADVRFFPQAVLIAWSLPVSTAGLGCGG